MGFLDDALTKSFEKEVRVNAQHTNRVSQAGIVCSRRLQWSRSRWRDAAPVEGGLQRRFKIGNVLEPVIVRALEDGGVRVIQQQRDLSWPELQLTGHIDGIVQETMADGAAPEDLVLDVKTCSTFVFEKIRKRVHCAADLLALGTYLAGYVSQVSVYALLMGLRRGVLFFVNKESFQTRTVVVDLMDPAVLDAAEAFLKRLEAVNKAIADGVDLPPETGDYCQKCPFVAVCMPDLAAGALSLVQDEEVEGWLEERETLAEAASRYEELAEALKSRFATPGDFLVGNWQVRVTEFVKKAFTVPEKKQQRRVYARVATPAVVVKTEETKP